MIVFSFLYSFHCPGHDKYFKLQNFTSPKTIFKINLVDLLIFYKPRTQGPVEMLTPVDKTESKKEKTTKNKEIDYHLKYDV